MEQSRPRDRHRDLIIDKKQSVLKFLISLLITSVFWIYSLVVVYFFISAIFNTNDKYTSLIKIAFKTSDREIRLFLFVGIIIFLSFLAMLMFWRTYNKKRFGRMNRRANPGETSLEDWETLGLIDQKTITELQHAKYIEFDRNPVRELS